ncbi:MAG: trimeric intracellular cation channel family protein [Muribaculaceae bacterium]|nr:trimeric intracellular cation channel family protein [Muribaculaceae bacterium]
MEESFLFIIEVIGTFAFAISGIRLAAFKSFDWFGAYVVGLVTAIGGGTLRDLLLDIPVFWMQTWMYLGVTGISLAIVIIFRKMLVSNDRMLFVFDTLGLALFVVIGIQKTLATGYGMWVAIVMGMVTGSFGSVLRDILINETPLFFRKDIYATACIAGGIGYWIATVAQRNPVEAQLTCALTIIILRLCALRWNWSLPVLRYDPVTKTDTTAEPHDNPSDHIDDTPENNND